MISYGGVILCTWDQALAAWCEQHITFSAVQEFVHLCWPGRNRTNWAPLLSSMPDYIEVGRLFWPQGASRFAIAHAICTDAELGKIRPLVYSPPTKYNALPFVLNDGSGTITTNLYMLPPRPLAQAPQPSGAIGTQLYLLTLVDDRYFWWERAASILVDGGTTTWEDLYAAIGSALGVSIAVDAIPDVYLKPDIALTSDYEYLPLLLDAVAANVGQRIVRTLAGDVLAQGYTVAKASQQRQYGAWPIEAGGKFFFDPKVPNDLQGLVPEEVVIAFRQTLDGAAGTELYPVSVTLTSLMLPEFPAILAPGHPGAKFYRDAAIAVFDTYTVDSTDPGVTPSTTVFGVNGSPDIEAGQTLSWSTGANAGATSTITDVTTVGSGLQITIAVALGSVPSDGDTFVDFEDAVEVNGLAAQIATDFYRWCLGRSSVAYAGIVPYTPDGFADKVIWYLREGKCQTRVERGAWNDLVEDLLHWTGPWPSCGCVPGDGTDGYVLTWDSGTYDWAPPSGGGSGITITDLYSSVTVSGTTTITLNTGLGPEYLTLTDEGGGISNIVWPGVFDTGTTGDDFNIDISGFPSIVFNIPDASATVTTLADGPLLEARGVVNVIDQYFQGTKSFVSEYMNIIDGSARCQFHMLFGSVAILCTDGGTLPDTPTGYVQGYFQIVEDDTDTPAAFILSAADFSGIDGEYGPQINPNYAVVDNTSILLYGIWNSCVTIGGDTITVSGGIVTGFEQGPNGTPGQVLIASDTAPASWGDASAILYNPTTSSDWTTPPTSVGEVLDNVANLTGSAALSFGTVGTTSTADLTIAVTGAVTGDVVTLGVPDAAYASAYIGFEAWVSAADTVKVRCYNGGLSQAIPGSLTFKVKIFKE